MRAVLLVSLVGIGCFKPDQAEPPPKPLPITVAEGEEWGGRAEKALNGCDHDELEQLFDMETAVRIAVAGKVKTGAEQRGAVEGARRGLRQMFEQMCAARGDGAYKRMKVREQDGETRVLIRLAASDGANYIDWVVGKHAGSKRVQAHDGYIYGTGQRLTETFGELIDAMLSSRGGELSRTMELNRMQRMAMAGQHQEALDSLERLEPAIKNSRSGRFMRLTFAAGVSDERYREAIEAYERAYPGDPSLDFVSIDGYFLRKDYPKALAALERLEQRIGSDAYLRTTAAAIYYEDGKVAEARASLDRALQLEPDYADAKAMRDVLAAEPGTP
jgi:tetratricopeptide (TPR) repeat protein